MKYSHKLNTVSSYISSGAKFSQENNCKGEHGKYRYLLWRQWDDAEANSGMILWLMLNPSTADEKKLDPTLRRCETFTRKWKYAHFEVANLFALRSSNPALLLTDIDPIGPNNDAVIEQTIDRATIVVVGWGSNKFAATRYKRIVELSQGKNLYCLGVTKDGWPRHPLYIKNDTELQIWKQR
jgi:hypothetical protein